MVLGALSCGAELGPDAIEAELRAYLAAREIEPEAVRCPGSLPRERGRSVECASRERIGFDHLIPVSRGR